MTPDSELEARRRRTVLWVVGLATLGWFSTATTWSSTAPWSRPPAQPERDRRDHAAIAGALGSYALVGVLVGALLAGTVGDILGRRKVMLAAYAWFSVGMAFTAMTSSASLFGILRFVTGLGVGALVATTGALVSEYGPRERKTCQRDHLFRGADRQPNGGAAGHHPARRDRLAQDEGGPVCLNSVSAWISGASAGFRLPRSAATG